MKNYTNMKDINGNKLYRNDKVHFQFFNGEASMPFKIIVENDKFLIYNELLDYKELLEDNIDNIEKII